MEGIRIPVQRENLEEKKRVPFKQQPFSEFNDSVFSRDPKAQFNSLDYHVSPRTGQRSGDGWKIHVPYEQMAPSDQKKVTDLLNKLGFNWYERDQSGHIVRHRDFPNSQASYKVGSSSDQEGKGMTIYVGSKNNLDAVARELDAANALMPQTPLVRMDDINVMGDVWARFDTRHMDFNQYGLWGIPIQDKFKRTQTWQNFTAKVHRSYKEGKGKLDMTPEEVEKIDLFVLDGVDKLAQEYGSYFTGEAEHISREKP